MLGLTRTQLATELELSEDTIEHWESGAGKVPCVYARQIAWLAAVGERFPPMPEPPLSPGLRVLPAIALGVARLPA